MARRGRPIGYVFLVAQAFLLAVMEDGMGCRWGLIAPIAAAIAVELAACVPAKAAAACQALVLALGLRGLSGVEAWDLAVPRASAADWLSLSFVLISVSALALAARWQSAGLDDRAGDVERLDRSVAQLVDANMGFQRYAASEGARSAELERKRISRDIHDTAVHSLVNIIMLAEAATDALDRPDPRQGRGGGRGTEPSSRPAELLGTIIATAKGAVSDTRSSLRELRDMEDLAPPGLAAIDRLARVFSEATGVEVAVSYGNLAFDPGKETGEVIYRMVQEGLSNAFRHGAARRVNVNFWIYGEDETGAELEGEVPSLSVRIRDDGRGAPTVEKGIGLSGMEERVRALGGVLDAGGLEDGFEIRALIPLPEEADRG
jgi:Signal transduction histidine kinase